MISFYLSYIKLNLECPGVLYSPSLLVCNPYSSLPPIRDTPLKLCVPGGGIRMQEEYLITRKKRKSLVNGQLATPGLIKGDDAERRCGPSKAGWKLA